MSGKPRLASAVVVLGATAGLLASVAPSTTALATPQTPTLQPQASAKTTATVNAVKSPKVVWRRCGPGLQCGELVVPLD